MCIKYSISDQKINNYIKNYISESKLTNQTLVNLLSNKFTQKDILKIQEGNYIFDIEDFIYLTQKLNLDLEKLFNKIKNI